MTDRSVIVQVTYCDGSQEPSGFDNLEKAIAFMRDIFTWTEAEYCEAFDYETFELLHQEFAD